MITARHARLIGGAIAALLGGAERGSIAFLRCFSSEVLDALVGSADFAVQGYAIFGVIDHANSSLPFITADQAVELREDKDDPILFLIDPHRAGAGLDGIYSAGREIGEQELFREAMRLARNELPRGHGNFARAAVSAARRIGQRGLVTPWQEFEFLVEAGESPGSAVTRLGLWPIRCDLAPTKEDLDLSCTLVNRLLVIRDGGLTPQGKVAALLLDDPNREATAELEQFLRDAADTDPSDAVVRLFDHPSLWINELKPRFASEQLQEIDLVSWRRNDVQVHKWSGLRIGPDETTPRLVLDRDTVSSRDESRLEVRWNSKPPALSSSAVEYQVSVMSGDETLAVRTVAHKPKGPQKVVFGLEDFDEIDEAARFEAFVRVSATGQTQVSAADSEEFLLEFGHYKGVVSSTAGPVIRCLVEGVVTIDSKEDFDAVLKELHRQSHEDKKGYVAWQSPSGRSFRVLRPSLIREVELDWASRTGALGRWIVRVRADGSRAEPVRFHGIERVGLSEDLWDRLAKASRRLCDEMAHGPGLVACVHASRLPVIEEYLLAWTATLDQGPPELCLANTVEVRTLSGRTLGLIVLPSHPLRLAWHAAYDHLAAHVRYEEGIGASRVTDVLSALDSAQFPAMLPGTELGQAFIFGDTLGFHAVAMVSDRDREPKAAISLMASCLAGGTRQTPPSVDQQSAKVLAREIGHYLDCHTRRDEEGRTSGLNLLHLHAFKAGDGLVVGRALGQALKGRPAEHTEEGDEGERDLCFVLDLFASEGRDDAAGRFLLDLARRRRSGAGAIDPDDRWMLETVSRPGEISIPRLRWARRGDQTPAAPSHLAFAFDTFVSQLEPIPAHSLPQEQRPLHGYGLVLQMERCVELGDSPIWRTFPALKYEGEKHPVSRALTDRLARLQESIARATALRLGGDRSDWPVLTTRLPLESQERIQALHRSADWVITADRNVCIEYFDSPRDARTVYDAYIIDCVPERNDLGCLQLVTSTCNIEEVRDLFDEMLGQMGLSSSARNCEFVLWHLKGLSGRLAIRLASPATKSGELVALALVHAHCVEALGHDPVWLPLTDGFFIPLDEITDIVPSAGDGSGEGQRADLVYITAGARQPLVFRFVEVKFRRHLRTARSSELLEKMVEQVRSVRRRWEEHFFGARLSPSTRAIRRSALVRLLNFYLDKARRHHLSADAHERLRGEIDKLLLQGDSYVRAELESPECGYIFCPELRTVDTERLYAAGSEATSIYLFGPAFLPDATVGASRPLPPGTSATSVLVDPAPMSSAQVDGLPPTPPLEGGAENVDKHSHALETRDQGPLHVVLGANRTTDERVVWQLSIKANPHLMIVGLPGMGKTTSLVNLCQQVYTAGITPVVFSYHQDIDARLEAACGPLNLVDFNGLGFNPLQIDSPSPLAHIDVASELRDIFAAIFPDLGDIQTEKIRQAIKQSYADLGWGGGESRTEHPLIPPFQAFFNILGAKPKANAGLMARLTELSDFGFFEAAGSTRSLLDVGRPSVLRIHRTTNALLQRALASFVLYSIYKDMFKRGPQPALTHAVIFDEAHRASRLKLLPTMAKECRKFGISLILASQEVRDFDPSLFSAIASYLALRVTEYDAKVIAKIASSSEIEKRVTDRLKQLAKYTGLFFTEGNSRPVQIALLDELGRGN